MNNKRDCQVAEVLRFVQRVLKRNNLALAAYEGQKILVVDKQTGTETEFQEAIEKGGGTWSGKL